MITQHSLNPCFSGICIQRRYENNPKLPWGRVLILVLVEYAFRALHNAQAAGAPGVLILVLVEYAFRVSAELASEGIFPAS